VAEDWPYTMFVRHPDLYMPFLEYEGKYADQDVQSLLKLFHEFNVPSGSKVLDLNCGIGRHSIPLAEKGYKIVGYDLSSFYLHKAMSYANNVIIKNNKPRFYQGEANIAGAVLAKNREQDFDAILILSNSVGYKTEDYDLQTLKSISKVANKNCILIIETENRDWRIKNFQPYINFQFRNLEVFEQWKFNLSTSFAEGKRRFYKSEDGKELRLLLDLDLTIRLYSLHEIKRALNATEWSFLKGYSTLRTLGPASYDSEHLVTVGQLSADTRFDHFS
jgi:SAM-dependent methyltransferase